MSRVAIDEERCKGCLLCTDVCPKHLLHLSDRINHQGYKVAEFIDENTACTACASCALMCPDVAISVFKSSRGAA